MTPAATIIEAIKRRITMNAFRISMPSAIYSVSPAAPVVVFVAAQSIFVPGVVASQVVI
jgi:hypothetical protein